MRNVTISRGLVFGAALVGGIGFACAAQAQTTPSILSLIAQYESSDNPTAQNPNPNSTASGLYGNINSTFAEALSLCGCGTTAQYPSAYLAPASVQTAAEVALLQQNGLSDYTCAGCDPALTAAIDADGGPSAFTDQIAALSTDPASYASLDTSSGLAAFLASDATDPGITVTSPDLSTTSSAAATVSSTPSALSSSFALLWQNTVNSVQSAATGLLQSIQLMVQHYFSILLALAIAVLGYRTMIGRMEAGELLSFIIYAVFIAAFVAVGSTFYNTYVLQPVIGLPGWWQSWINQGVGTAGGGPATPVTLLDQIYNAIYSAINKMAASASPAPWNWGHDFFIFLVGLIAWWTADIGLWFMFAAVWTTTILSYVLLIVGPVIIPFGLFRVTRQIMLSWVWGLGSLLASLFMSSILLALWQSQLVTLLGAASLTGTPDTDAPGFFQLGFVVLVMGATVPATAILAGRMFGGAIDTGLERASYHLSGASARDGALAAGRAATNRVL